jgi:hypothetical protein
VNIFVEHGHQPRGQAYFIVQQGGEQVRCGVLRLAVFVGHGLRNVQAAPERIGTSHGRKKEMA